MKTYLYIVLVSVAFTACNKQNKKIQISEKPEMLVSDPHTFSQPAIAKVNHLDLELVVNFESKTLDGKAIWTFDNFNSADSLVLDTRGLSIKKVMLDKGTSSVKFKLTSPIQFLGSALVVPIKPETKTVTVEYTTNPDAAALQWLDPKQTAGKKLPFLFTQSQAILARTWIPCQDSPGIRFTYNAKVKVPKELLAIMSAENPVSKNPNGEYSFRMTQPIPSYLMALSVGDLEFKGVDSRTGVYAEPATLAAARYELEDMGKMVDAAEKLYGPYRWDRFDVLMLPPSFPFGGMENPRITFATPTILAGDRSLVSLIAHELAHSWSGNLVTNATWDDFWLNEGFTVYFERRIMEEIEGIEYAKMLESLGYDDLKESIAEMKDNLQDTHLKLNLKGRDPDEGVTNIAYEKGYFFLRTIEDMVGRDKFDLFVKEYFKTYAFKVITTEEFLTYLNSTLLKDSVLQNKLNEKAWVYEPGLPSNIPAVNSTRFDQVDKSLAQWKQGEKAKSLITKEWTSHEWVHFINRLPSKLDLNQMNDLDQTFQLSKSGNSEILAAWLLHVVNNNYQPGYSSLDQFLVNVGRRKFLSPLYQALIKTPEGKKKALEIYSRARENYHFVATQTLDAMLDYKSI